jgi:hypothetical protein
MHVERRLGFCSFVELGALLVDFFSFASRINVKR